MLFFSFFILFCKPSAPLINWQSGRKYRNPGANIKKNEENIKKRMTDENDRREWQKRMARREWQEENGEGDIIMHTAS